jgi:NDP-sugar pyrophosphorylase family protein
MIPVLGRPFLDHQIELLEKNGMTRFLLLVSYLGHVIEEHLGDGERHGVEIRYSYEQSPLGTGGALKNAAGLLEDEFIVINGDTLLDIDYGAFARDFRSSRSSAMIAAYRNISQVVPSNLEIGPDGAVLKYVKQHPTGEYVDAGVVALRKPVLDLIPQGEKCSLEQEIFPILIERGEMKAWPTAVSFFDMGTPAGLAALEAHLR